MFTFNYAEGASLASVWFVWILIFVLLLALNEVTRRFKAAGLTAFVILPIGLSVVWFTVLKDTTYTDWFHLAKVYSSTAGCIGFWCIRHLHGKNKKTGKVWRISQNKIALMFPPLILAINIAEAVARDMIWPDMMWFWIVAYDLWNFTYTYNCLPGHAWYCGFALLLAPTVCSFTIAKGAWLQHRAQTLALWCMFAQTFPSFIDEGKYVVSSTYNETVMFCFSLLALLVNIAVFVFMIYKVVKTKKNPYKQELYTDMQGFKAAKELAE